MEIIMWNSDENVAERKEYIVNGGSRPRAYTIPENPVIVDPLLNKKTLLMITEFGEAVAGAKAAPGSSYNTDAVIVDPLLNEETPLTATVSEPVAGAKAASGSSYNTVHAGAISGFIAGPAIRCLSNYISGENKDKTCLDHYYNTFSYNNLLHVGASVIISFVLHACSVSTVNKNDYLYKQHPFALGVIHTAGYDLLDLTYSLGKAGYNYLLGVSENHSEF